MDQDKLNYSKLSPTHVIETMKMSPLGHLFTLRYNAILKSCLLDLIFNIWIELTTLLHTGHYLSALEIKGLYIKRYKFICLVFTLNLIILSRYQWSHTLNIDLNR